MEYTPMNQRCADTFCIGFTNFMLKNQNLTDFPILFSLNNFKNKNKVILNYYFN